MPLFIVSNANTLTPDWLKTLDSQDAVLLTADGCYLLQSPQNLLSQLATPTAVYVLAPDALARGITAQTHSLPAKWIDYDDWVDLTEIHSLIYC